MNIVAEQKKAESEAKIAEQNSAKQEDSVVDIFSEICEEKKDTSDEDVNIF